MILVTGAAGKTGRAVVEALVSGGIEVRAAVHRRERIPELEALGAREVVLANMDDSAALHAAFVGVEKAYHICPNMHPDELDIGERVIRAAIAGGCRGLVYHSVLRPQIEAMPHHWQKMRVEEKLFESGLPFTILQPAPYLQNLLAGRHRIVDEGVYEVPYAASTRISMVDLADVAEVARRVLTEPGHEGAVYELVGPSAPDQPQIAEALTLHLERDVRLEVVDRGTWKHRALESGLADYAAETLVAMFEYYERYGFVGSPTVAAHLLDRRPTDLGGFLRRMGRRLGPEAS